MSYKNIVFEHFEDGIATITVNRPEKLNALDRETMGELETALDLRPERAHCARSDRYRRRRESRSSREPIFTNCRRCERSKQPRLLRGGQTHFAGLELMGKPSIAAINGFALGSRFGTGDGAARFGSPSPTAKLGLPELKLGLIPGYGGTQRLPQLVGRGRALELMLTGDKDRRRSSAAGSDW